MRHMFGRGKSLQRVSIALAAMAMGLLVVAPSRADTPAEPTPKETMYALQIWNSQVLEKQPALMKVEASVLGDCRAKAPQSINWVAYCSCAKALVMRMWLSGIDPAMVKRVNDYAVDPKSADPDDFLKYQGPELYRPLCEAAVGPG